MQQTSNNYPEPSLRGNNKGLSKEMSIDQKLYNPCHLVYRAFYYPILKDMCTKKYDILRISHGPSIMESTSVWKTLFFLWFELVPNGDNRKKKRNSDGTHNSSLLVELIRM